MSGSSSISVLPHQLDLRLYAGDGFALRISFTQDGSPWDASGDWLAQVRATPDSDSVIASFVVDDSNAALGQLMLSLLGDDTRKIADAGNGSSWDLQQTPAGAEPRTWYRGLIRVLGDVSREP